MRISTSLDNVNPLSCGPLRPVCLGSSRVQESEETFFKRFFECEISVNTPLHHGQLWGKLKNVSFTSLIRGTLKTLNYTTLLRMYSKGMISCLNMVGRVVRLKRLSDLISAARSTSASATSRAPASLVHIRYNMASTWQFASVSQSVSVDFSIYMSSHLGRPR